MKKENVKVGMKVVPHSKSSEDFPKWLTYNRPANIALRKKGYLTVEKYNGSYFVCDGDWFNASDFEPYIENPPIAKRSPTQRIKSVHIGRKTTVTLADGRIGTALLDKRDSFDPVKGVALAYLRALGKEVYDVEIIAKTNKPLSCEELSDREELCDHCPLPKESRGVHCYGGQPYHVRGLALR
jgi:hypothetical protein